MSTVETLKDEERSALDSGMCPGGMKALRIIDAHAADRAALVLELDERRKVDLENCKRIDALVAQVAELTRERDEALRASLYSAKQAQSAAAEVTRLTEALAVAERDERQARHGYESMMAELDAAEALVWEWRRRAAGAVAAVRITNPKLADLLKESLFPGE